MKGLQIQQIPLKDYIQYQEKRVVQRQEMAKDTLISLVEDCKKDVTLLQKSDL